MNGKSQLTAESPALAQLSGSQTNCAFEQIQASTELSIQVPTTKETLPDLAKGKDIPSIGCQ